MAFSTVIDDLNTVFRFLTEVADKWETIGLELHLRDAKLRKLKVDNRGNGQDAFLLDMLRSWLHQNYDTKKFGKPTWRMLVNTLQRVEDCEPVAEEVLKQEPWKQR